MGASPSPRWVRQPCAGRHGEDHQEDPVEYRAIANVVRESIATPPEDAVACTRLATRAAELGVPATVVDGLRRLWTPEGWVASRALQADVAPAVIWN
jgi:hypothetical protein